MLSREEIKVIYEQGPDAVIALVERPRRDIPTAGRAVACPKSKSCKIAFALYFPQQEQTTIE